jgi:hypothetical protein
MNRPNEEQTLIYLLLTSLKVLLLFEPLFSIKSIYKSNNEQEQRREHEQEQEQEQMINSKVSANRIFNKMHTPILTEAAPTELSVSKITQSTQLSSSSPA